VARLAPHRTGADAGLANHLAVLTIRKLRVASEDIACARRLADYVLAPGDAPRAFAVDVATGARQARYENGTSAIWNGSAAMLETLGVRSGAEVLSDQLTLGLQGRDVIDGKRIRREGMIELPTIPGRSNYDETGRRPKVRTKGTKSVDLTFSAPKSVSVVWSQANPRLRAELEAAMLEAAAAMLEWMTTTMPVVSFRRALQPAVGFAAALALHVTARSAPGHEVPAPQLHVHSVLLGVERSDGLFAAPELSGFFKRGAPLEGGAVGRARLAESLADLGFGIEAETGRNGRFFEIAGVPAGLVQCMSARTRDVEAKVLEREAAQGRSLTSRERAVAALQTRAPKRAGLRPAEIAAVWRRQAEEFNFGQEALKVLQTASTLRTDVAWKAELVRADALRRLRLRGPAVSTGEARAGVLESAAGKLTLDDALTLLSEMEIEGELSARR
jgi:conjugative relaxase-like TrwC/TraI family protein